MTRRPRPVLFRASGRPPTAKKGGGQKEVLSGTGGIEIQYCVGSMKGRGTLHTQIQLSSSDVEVRWLVLGKVEVPRSDKLEAGKKERRKKMSNERWRGCCLAHFSSTGCVRPVTAHSPRKVARVLRYPYRSAHVGGLLLRYSYCMPGSPNKGETWAHNARYLMKLQPVHQQPGRSPGICLSPLSRATGQFSGRQVPVTLRCAKCSTGKGDGLAQDTYSYPATASARAVL